MRLVASLSLIVLVGCSGSSSEPAPPIALASTASTYTVSQTAHFTGATGEQHILCNGTDALVDAHCDASAGTVTTSAAFSYQGRAGWRCVVTYADTAAGGDITASATCQP